jgi:hypothetical protein
VLTIGMTLQDELESMRARHAAQLKKMEIGFENERKEAQRTNDKKDAQISALRADARRRSVGGTGGSGGLLALKEVVVEVPSRHAADAREPPQVAALERRIYSDREHFSEIQRRLGDLEQSVELEKTLQETFAAFSDVRMKLEYYKQRCEHCEGRLSVVGRCQMSEVGIDSTCAALAAPNMAAGQRDGAEEDALANAAPRPAGQDEARDNDLSWAEGQTRRIRGRLSSKPKIDCWRPKVVAGATPKTPQGPGVQCMPMHRSKFSASSPSLMGGKEGRVTESKGPLSSFREAARSQLRRCVNVVLDAQQS